MFEKNAFSDMPMTQFDDNIPRSPPQHIDGNHDFFTRLLTPPRLQSPDHRENFFMPSPLYRSISMTSFDNMLNHAPQEHVKPERALS